MPARKRPSHPRGKIAARTPRTATGKKMSSELLASAEQESQHGLRQRTEEGHLAAGRTLPGQRVFYGVKWQFWN